MAGLRAIVLAATLMAAACTQARVHNVESYAGPALPPPNRVVVSYFAIAPEQVRLDQGVGARLRRATGDAPPDAQKLQAAQAAQLALAQELVERLQRYGLPATIGASADGPDAALYVQGQIVDIDQGNRTRRVLVGLGAGKSTVSADVQLYYTGQAAPRFLTAFQGEADSGRAPGAAETMGAGAVAGRVASSAAVSGGMHAGMEARNGGNAETNRLADGIARQIGHFAVAQGWIPAAAVH
jgi:hypothetical protein